MKMEVHHIQEGEDGSMSKNILISLMLAIVLLPISANAQFIEDALRLTQLNGIGSARAGAIGVAFSGIADDYSALTINPAGLVLLPKSEFSLGLQQLGNKNTADFLSTQTPISASSTSLNSLGYVTQLKSRGLRVTLGVGYSEESDLNSTINLTGFNPSSSIVSNWVNSMKGADITTLRTNPAYQLFLAGIINGVLTSPINKNTTQSAFIQEKGGLHNITGGVGFDIAPTVSAGVALSSRWGAYTYSRRYIESDDKNYYQQYDTLYTTSDFDNLVLQDNISQDISGVNVIFGIQWRVEDLLRFGITIKTPTSYRITETFSETGTATFDNKELFNSKFNDGNNSYTITTPFVFGAGMSAHLGDLTMAASVEYSDLTQLEFSEGLPEVMSLNIDIAKQLASKTTFGIGAEYDVRPASMVVRGGFTEVSAPYLNDISGANTRIISLGAGFYLAKNVRLDLTYLNRINSYQRANYTDNIFSVNNSSSMFALQFVSRF